VQKNIKIIGGETMFEQLEIGQPYTRIVHRGEGVYFDIRDGYTELIYNMVKPTENELAEVDMTKPFEIRAVEINDVIFITTKFGSLLWMDAPYNPRLGDCRLDEITSDTKGYGLQFFLTDSPSGTIRHMRLIGLGNKFSKQLHELVYANKKKEIEVHEHDKRIREIYANLSSKDIADRSRTIRFKLK
jgi:hypothetical protein